MKSTIKANSLLNYNKTKITQH